MDDCVNHLSKKCKNWFADLGSIEIWNLKYRQPFVFIGKTGKFGALEKSSPDLEERVVVTQIFEISKSIILDKIEIKSEN